jgi:WD40 repeat protein
MRALPADRTESVTALARSPGGRTLATLTAPTDETWAIAWWRDRSTLVSWSFDGASHLWSPDERTFASSSRDATVRR